MEIPRPYDPLSDTDVPSKEMPPFYLILDGLSDPGNVGTLLRSCAASQVTALILLPNSCDVWNPKAVRSAMGASFRVPVLELTNADDKDGALDQKKSLAHFQVDWIRHTKDDSKSGGGSAIILGREGEGLRREVRAAIKQGSISTVHIPMADGVESLNAAVCGSVIMFERMRQWSVLNVGS
ncbi:predicted protein [Thalassiosira pseudonana CCMP1335]|uniref:tRNA/rRNA methyltransferase SpoU type domain-containing protein n=1 Tax=Thalassiosira pseudonana TaxID=35128 RepID=B8BQE1_THAPS|nr:predicted protein [Thalassiosira pseudonana CCMP1335]EED95766.1 predicted protein [Thalassiosira pseudonana CCMP1335]